MTIPAEVKKIVEKLNEAGFEAYVVGGCVRDLVMGKKPEDWDVTTNAKPEEIQKLFPDSFYENEFGTVGIKTESEEPTLAVVEVTTYRFESGYSDKRHPDEVKFAKKLEDDLQRRDFTMNALALDGDGEITDLFGGQEDIKNKIIRAVGDASERFNEDALRMLRAVRFSSTLGFTIEQKTLEAIKEHHGNLEKISKERIRDEFMKLMMGDGTPEAIEILRETGMLKYIIPELLEGVGVGQNLHHIYSVWEHNTLALKYTCEKKYSFEVRLAALLHDVAKPKTKRGEGYNSTFYGHEVVGARTVKKILERLKFPADMTEKITKLVRWHLFYYYPDEVTESSVRRLVANIGKENVEDLLKLREADRIGSGTPKAIPYKLRHLKFMIDKVARDPISPKMLKVNGDDIMRILKIEPGPKVGMIMNTLMEEVLEEPGKNTKEYLENRIGELNKMSETELKKLAEKGKLKTAEEEEKEIAKIKEKHFVK
ncbi:MAG: polynucleotide adenylyltransferase/metal dependent phosphohydrolase [Parcubacteria group bacterium Licking1014_17]|nr:MAG: polynucleotide adenylyltransferase/metal dependent phosphohydrolase [Parcubacteria group bacterium Licking1014_17]